MGTEHFNGQMVGGILASGKKANSMVVGRSLKRQGKIEKENGLMVGELNGLMKVLMQKMIDEFVFISQITGGI